MSPRSRPAVGVAMVLAASTLFAVNGTVSKLVSESGIDAPQLTSLRASGSTIGLFALALLIRPSRLRVTRRELPLLVTYGLAGFFFVPMLYFVAISRLPVGVGLLFEYTAPVLVALWARFVQGQAVRPRLWFGLAASLAGLACVAEIWGQLRLDAVGMAAGLGASILLASYYLLGARGVAARDGLSLTAYAFGVSALAGAAVRPWWNFDFARLSGDSGNGIPLWPLIGYLVVGGSIAPYLLLAGAMRHLPPTSVGIIGMSEPVVASIVAWIVLHEHLNLAQIGGGLLILAGVALAETARVRAGPDDMAPDPPELNPPERSGQDRGMQLHPNSQAVQDALDSAGALNAAGEPCQVLVLTEPAHTAAAAAALVGVEVGQIANSLIFAADGHPLLVLTSGAHRVDTAKVAALLAVDKVKRATVEFVREHTGQVIGGVSPLGHPKPVQTLVDTALAQYGEIWAAGGIPQAVFPITYAELVRVTAGTPAEIA